TDAGAHTFTNAVTLITAGAQEVTATDTATSTLTASQTVTISPGPTAWINEEAWPTAAVLVGQTVRIEVTVFSMDRYLQGTPDYNNTVHISGQGIPEQDIVLLNGRGTFGFDVTESVDGLEFSIVPSVDDPNVQCLSQIQLWNPGVQAD